MTSLIEEFVVQKLLDGREVETNENLLLSGLVDSLGVMRLVRFLEETFDVSVPPEDVNIKHFMTISAIEAYIAGRRANVQ